MIIIIIVVLVITSEMRAILKDRGPVWAPQLSQLKPPKITMSHFFSFHFLCLSDSSRGQTRPCP